MNVERIAVLHTSGGVLYQSIIEYGFDQYKQEESSALDARNGAGNWVVLPAADLPADFSVDTYTIADGALVKASAEVLAERQAVRRIAEHEAIRAERERRYQSEPIASLYWTWIESGIEADRTAWIAAKEAVRLELPYPDAQEGGAQ